jgi:hypothetical protein
MLDSTTLKTNSRREFPTHLNIEHTAALTTPPRIADATWQNTSETPPPFKGTLAEVALL